MLKEQDRLKLDNIVSKMVENNEPEENIQFVVNDFKNKYDIGESVEQGKLEVEETPKEPSIFEGIEAMRQAGTSGILKPTETIQEAALDPKKTGARLLQAGQMIGGAMPFGMSAVTTTPATEFGIQKLKGATTEDAIKKARNAALIDAGVTVATGGLPIVKSLIRKGAKKTMPVISEIIAGVPREATERALAKETAGQSIFKGKFTPRETYQNLGQKAQKAVNYIYKKAGQAVGKEREALKSIKTKFNFDDVVNNIDELVGSKQFGREQILSTRDLSKINKISGKIRDLSKGGMEAGELYAVKKQIDDLVSYDPRTIKKISSEAEGVLKKSAEFLNDRLSQISPRFAKVNKKYGEMRRLHDVLRPKLKEESVAKNLRKIFKTDDYFEELFRKVDDLAPKPMKFVNKLEDTVAREQLERLAPVIAGAQSPMSLGLIGRGMSMYGGQAVGGKGGVFASFLGQTPLLHKQAIKIGGALARTKPVARAILKQAPLRIRDLIEGQK